MEKGTPPQNIENPLFLFPLFGEKLFVLKTDVQLETNSTHLPIENSHGLNSNQMVKTQQAVKILNLFPDASDNQLTENAQVAYEKLMTNIQLNGSMVQYSEVAMINLESSPYLKAAIVDAKLNIFNEIWSEFNTEYCLIWSDLPMNEPNMNHYSMRNFNTCKLIYLPGFNTMLNAPEIKKNTWIALKQLLGFV